YVKFDSYRQRDRGSCDRSFFGSDHCDPYFLISVSTPRKILATFVSSEYDNAPTVIHFGDFIGQLINPLEFHFTGSDLKPTDNVQVSVTVKDKDPGEHELMCRLHRSYNAAELPFFANNSANSRWSSQLTEISSNGPHPETGCLDQVQAELLPSCLFGALRPVQVRLQPQRLCDLPCRLHGSQRQLRSVTQGQAFCQNGGSCSEDLQGRPVCQCPMNFTGPHCQLETHPCHRNATWCRNGSCQTFNSNGSSVCVCDKGFTGYHCDQDVDECRLVAGLCGSYGDCVNTVGSFRCDCRSGFSGAVCQFQPPAPTAIRALTTASHDAPQPLNETLVMPILLLAVLLIVVCSLTAIVAGIMVYHRKHSSRVELRVNRVAYQPSSPQPVELMQPSTEPVESTYYEEVQDEPNLDVSQQTTGNFANSAYGRAQAEQTQLMPNSRSFSRKNSSAGSQQAGPPPQPPPRSSNTTMSKLGMDSYLAPN
uniref:Delta-like protein n=1 Tax=Macrostomum lignano TaxID=282301 RepID=A0A1I8JHQ5_9PLAT